MTILVRPEDLALCHDPSLSEENLLAGTVDVVVFMGDSLDCQLLVGSQIIRMKLHPEIDISKGQKVWVHLPPQRCRAIRA